MRNNKRYLLSCCKFWNYRLAVSSKFTKNRNIGITEIARCYCYIIWDSYVTNFRSELSLSRVQFLWLFLKSLCYELINFKIVNAHKHIKTLKEQGRLCLLNELRINLQKQRKPKILTVHIGQEAMTLTCIFPWSVFKRKFRCTYNTTCCGLVVKSLVLCVQFIFKLHILRSFYYLLDCTGTNRTPCIF